MRTMSNAYFVDFARCQCGHLTAVRPSAVVIPNLSPQPSGTDTHSIFVACGGCKRVYSFGADDLESHQTTKGIGPYVAEAPMHVFRVPIPCDELDCQERLNIFAMLKCDVTDAEMKAEKSTWWWREGDLNCE